MNVRTVVALYTSICFRKILCEIMDFTQCHDDFTLNIKDGIVPYNSFPWLGFIQYVHERTGFPHVGIAPRVVLIHKQLILTTAKSIHTLPKGYKLGNVFFGDYELDDQDCGLTLEELKKSHKCVRAYLEVPFSSFDTHPEYSNFGIKDSLAIGKLLTPMKSTYMTPICLPSLTNRYRLVSKKTVFLVDYVSVLPNNFQDEKMGKKTLKVYPHKMCRRHRIKHKLDPEELTNLLCTTGCGVRLNSPIVSHSADGRFELVGLSVGGGECVRPSHRRRFNKNPPMYIDIYPYTTWIINVVTAYAMPKVYPNKLNKGSILSYSHYSLRQLKQKEKWVGKMLVIGNFCFRSKQVRKKAAYVYTEIFIMEGIQARQMQVDATLIVDCGEQCEIACMKLKLPYKEVRPKITGINTRSVKLIFDITKVPSLTFTFKMILFGLNHTQPFF